MSLESVSARREKRIVEHIVSGFESANEAIVFGNTLEQIVIDNIGTVKFKQSIGAPDTNIAITKDWTGKTVLKTIFLELKGQSDSEFVRDSIKKVISSHEEVHKTLLNIEKEIIREKPQPQFIG